MVKNKKRWGWFRCGLGRFVAVQEYRAAARMAGDVLGDFGVQLGYRSRVLEAAPVRHRLYAGKAGGMLVTDWRELPFASGAVDLLVLHHALEASREPKAVLREATRVLRYEGRLVVVGFNRLSLLGLSGEMPWRSGWLPLARLKDWLSLLEMQPLESRMLGFFPAWRRVYGSRRWRWLEAAGGRWWPLFGGVYVLHLVKRRQGVRLVLPTRRLKGTRLAAAGAERRVYERAGD